MALSTDAGELLALAEEAAQTAGELLRARFEAGPETSVASKSTPTDPVSEADLASQRAIRELLSSRRGEDSFLGEEEGADQRGSSGIRWVVDPLDGTVNYLYGIPQWCVSIAAFDEHGALAGVVHDPLRRETFTALRGGVAACNGAELEWRGDHVVSLGQSLLATGFGYDPALRAKQGRLVARLLPQVRDIRRFGSAALDLAWTAMGRHDAFYERGVKLWDTAAGVLVCECAGLLALEVDGGTLVAQSELAHTLAAIIEAERTSAQSL
ncbi:MAG TPA: inositol monophosphatase family protein [Solirubrobacteraceae bacterium]|nr:inositol monophosphatase family protein [Solirubrobacteraceae bacterium]